MNVSSVFWPRKSTNCHKTEPFVWHVDVDLNLAQESGTGTVTDGSKLVHSATVYWPTHPAGPPPMIDKEKEVFLEYHGHEEGAPENQLTWAVVQDGEVLRSYNESEIRFSLVYRARCFKDAAESAKYQKIIDGTAPEEEMMRLPVSSRPPELSWAPALVCVFATFTT